MNPSTPLVADRRYEVHCESSGSRPNAIITWYKGKRQLRRAKVSIKLVCHKFSTSMLQGIVIHNVCKALYCLHCIKDKTAYNNCKIALCKK